MNPKINALMKRIERLESSIVILGWMIFDEPHHALKTISKNWDHDEISLDHFSELVKMNNFRVGDRNVIVKNEDD